MVEETFGGSTKIGFFDKIVGSLTNPDAFFKAIRSESGLGKALVYFAILSLIIVIVQTLAVTFNLQILLPPYAGELTYTKIIQNYVTSLIGAFIIVGIFHLFVKLFNGVGDYSQTFKSYAYGMTAGLLFGWIPYLGVLGQLYSLYLFVKGLSVLHGLTMWKAFFAFFIPVLILIIIVAILFLVGAAYLAGLYSGSGLPFSSITGDIISVIS